MEADQHSAVLVDYLLTLQILRRVETLRSPLQICHPPAVENWRFVCPLGAHGQKPAHLLGRQGLPTVHRGR